jgi:DNA-binding GntR family transcriptional regulator
MQVKLKPVHQNIYDTIRKKIHNLEYQAGDLLPSENDYCKDFQITRPTVRQALAKLEAEGFIKKHKGKGSIVQAPKIGLGILSISSTTSATINQDLQTYTIKPPYQTAWPENFMFSQTDTEKEKGCLVLERIRSIKKEPILIEYTYFPDGELKRFKEFDFSKNSLFDILKKKYNIEVVGGEQKIKAISAPIFVAELLKIKQGVPILHLERKLLTSKTDFVFYSSIYCFTDNHYLNGTF